VAVHPARPRTDNAYKVSNESRRRTDLLGTTTDQERVKANRRVGEEGRKTRGKVGEKAAAARGPGTETTDLQADSVSLATPASGPLPRDDKLVLTKIPQVELKPPRHKSDTTQPIRTPHDTGSSGEGRGVAMSHMEAAGDEVGVGKVDERTRTTDADDKDCRAHERVDDKTGASAPSALRDHPDEDAETRNPPRPLEDPGDMTGDDERRPDGPTEPPDQPEGTRGRGGEARVETAVLKASRDVEEGPSEDGDEDRRPGVPDEPLASDELSTETRDRPAVQVEPGGEAEAERNERATLESADAELDGRVVGTHPDVQVEMESARAQGNALVEGASKHTTAHARSAATDDENDQRTSQDEYDVPGLSPEPPPPFTSPDEPARVENEPPSVELEGERRDVASCDVERTGGKADVSRASEGVEDDGNRSKKLWSASEHDRDRSKRINEENSPGRPGDEPDEPGGEAAVPGDVHSTQERPRCETSDVDNTNASRRGEGPGGQLDLQGESRGEEIVPDSDKDVEHAEYDGNRPRSEENARGVETSAPCRDTGPPGNMGERIESGGDGGSRERQSNGNGDQRGGIRCGKDDATSGARSDSKRVDTSLLAEGKAGQHERRKRETTDVPRPSTPPTDTSKRPMDHPNPPRHRGRLKTRPTRVSNPRWTYQATRTRQGRIGRIGRIVLEVYGPEMVVERSQGAIREDGATGVDRGRTART
jgi:hypothetical protein